MMVLWMLLMACSTERHELVLGCWQWLDGERIHCFKKDGSYRFASRKTGNFEGTWKRDDETLVITVESFPSDRYLTDVKGDSLRLSRKDRPDQHYERLREAPAF